MRKVKTRGTQWLPDMRKFADLVDAAFGIEASNGTGELICAIIITSTIIFHIVQDWQQNRKK